MEVTVQPSFNIDLPVDDAPVQVVEASLEAEPFPDIILEDVPTTYEVIVGGSQKDGDLLVDSMGFTYSRKRSSKLSTMWICSMKMKKCYATVNQHGSTYGRGPGEHIYAGDPGARLATKASAMVEYDHSKRIECLQRLSFCYCFIILLSC